MYSGVYVCAAAHLRHLRLRLGQGLAHRCELCLEQVGTPPLRLIKVRARFGFGFGFGFGLGLGLG